jgi:hypothetical protein
MYQILKLKNAPERFLDIKSKMGWTYSIQMATKNIYFIKIL